MRGMPPLGVLENTDDEHNLVVCTLCSCYPRAVLGYPPFWFKSAAYRARAVRDPRALIAEWGTVLPEGQQPDNADTSRANVAAVAHAVLSNDTTIGRKINFVDGDTPIAEEIVFRGMVLRGLITRFPAPVAVATQAEMMLAKPGMGVDEGVSIVGNEQNRLLAVIRDRRA